MSAGSVTSPIIGGNLASGRLASGRVGSLAAIAVYGVASGLYIGLPLLTGPRNAYVGSLWNTGDPNATFAIWLFGWWPHALLHGLNPLVTHAVWSPDGVNLMWVVAIPALAIPFAPLTLLLGAVTSYNIAVILLPAFIGWTGFVLCRYLTRSFWPSFVGGFFFASSGFELFHTVASHIALSASGALVPLIALVILRFINGEIGSRSLVVRLGMLVALELLLSLEILFTTALSIVVALALYFVFAPTRRNAIRRLIRPIVGSYALAAVLTSPFVYYLLSGFQSGSVTSPATYHAELTTSFLPSPFTLVGAGGTASAVGRQFPSLAWQPEAYLGLPALVTIWLFVRERRGTPAARFVSAALPIGLLATMGPFLVVAGHRILTFPWGRIDTLPLYDNVLPVRLGIFLELLAAVVLALWMAGRRTGRLRWMLPVLALIAVAPDPFQPLTTAYEIPPFFTDSAYRTCLDPGETILPLPITGSGTSLLWQAVGGFRFNISGGLTGLYIPADFKNPAGVHYITDGYHLGPYQALDVKSFIKRKHVAAAVVAGNEAAFFSGALDRIAKPQAVGGVVLYNFENEAPSCLGP